ncbi:AI-2E family transporter [Cellulomonas sp. PS-H5]|uniref:AI-2E family transporter n=1 Tax=Cellulomonas sp. PS-H5 TaxID=2820400 RepID=UPI001C4F27FA|nr:AI-2E family transporter [Cellulomonas sp. PS-H5]MBW0253872.1 AI-2E family transporter [Cellulomonas sp. PS-H5]
MTTPRRGGRGRARTGDPAAPAPVLHEGDLASGDTPAGWSAEQSVAPSVRAAAAWSWRFLLIAAATAAGLWVVGFFKVIVVSVAIALLLTVLLAPVARFLSARLRFPRGLAAITSVLLLLAVVTGLVVLAGRSIASGFGDLYDQASQGVDEALQWLSDGPLGLSTDQLDDLVQQGRDQISENASTLVSGALSVTTTVGHVAAGALIALFCTFFFLLDGRTIWTWLVGLLPISVRERVHQAGRRGIVTLSGYTRTQILVAFVDATGIGIGAAVLGVPLAVPLATLVFVGSFIPIVGAIATGAVAVLVALVAQGPVVALLMLGVVLLVQQIEGHVLQPFLMGHAVSLHPVAVLLVVAAGSLAAGIVGALFAVPIAAVLNTVLLYLHGHDKFPELGTDDHVTLRPPGAFGRRRLGGRGRVRPGGDDAAAGLELGGARGAGGARRGPDEQTAGS